MKYVFRKPLYSSLAGAFDSVGKALFRRREWKASSPRTALIVRLDHLGDILAVTGIPQALKEHYPSCRVVFLTSSAGAALLENNPYVDDVLVYDAPWFRRPGAPRSNSGFWKTLSAVRALNADLGLSLRGDLRENLLLFLARVRGRIGYGITGGGFLLHRELSYREEAPEIQHSLDVLRAAGIRREMLLPSIFFSEAENAQIIRLAAGGVGARLVGVQFDAGSPAKTWPEVNRDEFLKNVFHRLPNASFVFVGSDSSVSDWLTKRLQQHAHPRALNLIGKTNLRELLMRLKSCSFFIGPDSGPAHLAAALGVPTLFLYSGTNVFEKWKPLSENADFLRNPVPCSPCHLTECPIEGHPCMSGIAPEKVLRWLTEQLHAA